MAYFDPVDSKVNFPKMERDLLEHWYKDGIVKKYLNKNKSSKKYFSFQDGPITANNPMGVHHAWGRTYKDLWPRFYNMRGYKQRFQNGFDCQGLWVEVDVEKGQGFKNKKDIEKFGVEKFVNLCKERVKKYSQVQTKQSKRLGYFADWENSYYTLSDDNNYMIWHFLKVCHENGWLYKGAGSVPWCSRCETAISQHEVLTEDYKETTHESIYIKFPVDGKSNEYLLVWTTTPWAIPANIAIAVDKKLDYVLVQTKDKNKYWLADETKEKVLGNLDYKVIEKIKGEKLVGLKYTGAFDNLPAVLKVSRKNSGCFHKVVATNNLIMPITTTEGTGLVHTAVSAGTEDFNLGRELDLPMISVINDDASYLAGFDFLTGKNAKENPRLILDYMEEKGFAFKIEKYIHRYPACWRCKTELVWKVTDEWYIAMDRPSRKVIDPEAQTRRATAGKQKNYTLRERMKSVAKKINWIPEFGLKRELDWLDSMRDWLISKKNRYWGLALPIWECAKCGNFEVIGSKDELREKSIKGWKQFEGKSPHKPQIDEIKIKCSKCGEAVSRIEPVGDPWLDAGIVPFSTISGNNKSKPLYLTDREEWLKWYPVDFITESFPGQFKNWFYAMIAMSTVLEDREPFKSVLGFASLLAEDGRPMHKSWGNSIEFNEGADKIGVDVLRWMYVRQDPRQNLLFGYKAADEIRRQFHLKLWNIYNFFVTYANLDGWKPRQMSDVGCQMSVLDRWILARLNQTVNLVTKSLEKYDPYNSSGAIDKFVDDVSLWYIRRSRGRVGFGAEDENDKNEFYNTCYCVLTVLSKILAPFNPFISEIIYKNLSKEESVHLADWPHFAKASRGEPKDKELIKEMQKVREIVEKAHAERKEKGIPVRQPLNKLSIYNSQFTNKELEQLILDELNIKNLEYVKGKGELKVVLDTTITPELEEEAKLRDLVRKIQGERKKQGLVLSQKIDLYSEWLPSDDKDMQWLIKKAQIRNISKGNFKVANV